MPGLSTNALRKRENDMIELTNEVDPLGYCRILLIGLWFLVETMTNKFTPRQRAALVGITILAGGSLIVLFLRIDMAWMVLVIGIVIGWMISEISRL